MKKILNSIVSRGQKMIDTQPLKLAIWSMILVFVVCAVLTLLFIVLNFSHISNLGDITKTGPLGDSYNGLLGPFIAFLVAILTFLAFWAQYNSNLEQRQQFERQNQDQMFFRIMDAQSSRIINSTIKDDDKKEISGYTILEYIVNKFYENVRYNCRSLARQLVCNNFNDIPNLYYGKMFDAIGISPLEFEDEKDRFIEIMMNLDKNQRWEHIKYYFGSLYGESEAQVKALESIGSVHFYKSDFEERKSIYEQSFENLDRKFGVFLDGYFKGCEFIFEQISKTPNQTIYRQYLFSQLTRYEKILIFYYAASSRKTDKFVKAIKENDVLIDIFEYNDLLIDLPSKEEVQRELEFILK